MRIGELARRASVDVQTVRYYERRGLLPEPRRTTAVYRSFADEHLLRLQFVLRAKELGFNECTLIHAIETETAGEGGDGG